jgi:GntR family histidine utilization transcriptional repressor
VQNGMKRQDSAQPLYRQVKERLAQQIRKGEYRPGDRVPSEHELVDQLAVSRMTVNRAIRELAAEGWLTRVQGVGTFVSEPKSQSALLEIRSIADDIAERGGTHSAKVVKASVESADADTAFAIGLRLEAQVFRVILVHYENGRPIQIEDRYVNPTVAPKFLAQDFTSTTPSDYLLRHVPYTEMEHIIEATGASEWESRLLEIEAKEPCLVLNRRTWTNSDVVTKVRLIHPGGIYRLGSRFKPLQAPHSLVA